LSKVQYLEIFYDVSIVISNGVRSGSTYTFTITVTKNAEIQQVSNIVATFIVV